MPHIRNFYFGYLFPIPLGVFEVCYSQFFPCCFLNLPHRIASLTYKTQGCFVYLRGCCFQQICISNLLIPSLIIPLLLLASSCQLENLSANCCWSSLKMKDNTNIQRMYFTSGKKLSNANSLSRLSSLRS